MTDGCERSILSYATPPSKLESRRGRGFIAVCAGLVLTGLGHAIVGRIRRASVWFLGAVTLTSATLLAVAMPRLFPALIVLLPVSLLWNLAALVDAYRCGRQSPFSLLPSPLTRYVAGTLVLILMCIAGRFFSPVLAITSYVKQHVSQAFVITSNSMAPTIILGDRIQCDKRAAIARWSIVVLDAPLTPKMRIVKRIVGLPGETVQLLNGHVCINGILQPLPAGVAAYSRTRPDGTSIGGPGCDRPIRLGSDEYYCLGDNSAISADSRSWPSIGHHQAGALPAGSIVGTVTYIYWPLARWRKLL